MITLHHLEYSQSFRVLWLLEELSVEYKLIKYQRDPKTLLAPTEYKAISPIGTAPVITHNGITMAETSAIIDYLLNLYPNDALNPPSTSQHWPRHLFWFHAAQGSIMPLMLTESIFAILQKRVPSIINLILRPVLNKASQGFVEPRMSKILGIAEKDLATNKWFGGNNLSSADILLSYPLESANARGFISDKHVNTKAWIDRIHQRDAFQAATQKDGRESMILPL